MSSNQTFIGQFLAKVSDRALGLVALACAAAAVFVQQRQLYQALGDAHPIGDLAIFELNVRLAIEGLQRFGPYSQGFHHPGPAFFYFLAVPYVAMGAKSYGLYVGSYLLTAGFIGGIVVGVSRWTNNWIAALIVAPFVALECAYLGDFPLFDYWPPYVLFFGYACFLVLGAGVAAAPRNALLPFLCVGSLLVQTHIGYALPVVGAVLVSARSLASSRPLDTKLRRQLALSILAVALLWALPVYSDLFEGTTNLQGIVHTFARGATAKWKLRSLFDRVALEFTGPFQFALFRDRFIVPEAPKHFIVGRVLFVAQVWVLAIGMKRARERGDRFLEALCTTCFASIPIAVFALYRIGVTGAPHHTAWISSLGTVSAIAGLSTVAPSRLLARGTQRPALRIAIVAVVLLSLCLLNPVAIIPGNHLNPEIRGLASTIEGVIRDVPNSRVVIDSVEHSSRAQGRSPSFELLVGVILELEKRGFRLNVRRAGALQWALGHPRWNSISDDPLIVTITTGAASLEGQRLTCVDDIANFFVPSPVCLWLAD